MKGTPYNSLVDFTQAERLTDVLMGRPTIMPKPMYDPPMEVAPPKGFEALAEAIEKHSHVEEENG